MSWLARSLASSLNPDQHLTDEATGESSPPSPDAEARGVKEDLSELTETLTRQFWGVASFLAPPPPPPPPLPPIPSSTARRRPDPLPTDQVPEIRRDFSGRFRSGISRFSNNAAEISKITSNFLPFREEEEEEQQEEEEEEDENGKDSRSAYSVSAIGLTDEVLAYARNISMHPETWLDFPLFYDFEDCDDFDMSDAQQDHALAVEHLLPRLAALRIELCPNHMTDGCFWKIYFVLLHSRLNKHDAELLSTPQIVEAKAMLLRRLQEMKLELENANKGTSYRNSDDSHASEVNSLYDFRPSKLQEFEGTQPPVSPIDHAMEKHRLWSTEVVTDIVDKSFIPEELFPSVGLSIQNYVDDHEGDAWLEEESRALGESGAASIHLINEEDVSFSDLEDDGNCSMPASYKAAIPASNMCTSYTHTKTMGSNNLFNSDEDFDNFMRL